MTRQEKILQQVLKHTRGPNRPAKKRSLFIAMVKEKILKLRAEVKQSNL